MLGLLLLITPQLLHGQASASAGATPAVPDWAQPGSATHEQVPPPANFHRASRNFDTPIGIF
ncbi:MAG: biopolymer transporter Tol, partial [Acidobacteriaceae bacterium]